MTFERSDLGQKNRSLFFNVDAIVYVEGGREDDEGAASFDSMFWKRMFTTFRPDLRVKAIPRGSKGNVLSVLDDTDTAIASNVFFAVDRDYDELFDRLRSDKNLLYTYGYSFESDAFAAINLPSLFCDVCPVNGTSTDYEIEVNTRIDEFVRDTWWAQLGDACGTVVGRKVIDRDRPQKYLVQQGYGCEPRVLKGMLAADVFRANTGGGRIAVTGVRLTKDMLPRLSVGHFYAAFCSKLMTYLHRLHGGSTKLTNEGIMSIAITSFSNLLLGPSQSDVKGYYSGMFAALA